MSATINPVRAGSTEKVILTIKNNSTSKKTLRVYGQINLKSDTSLGIRSSTNDTNYIIQRPPGERYSYDIEIPESEIVDLAVVITSPQDILFEQEISIGFLIRPL